MAKLENLSVTEKVTSFFKKITTLTTAIVMLSIPFHGKAENNKVELTNEDSISTNVSENELGEVGFKEVVEEKAETVEDFLNDAAKWRENKANERIFQYYLSDWCVDEEEVLPKLYSMLYIYNFNKYSNIEKELVDAGILPSSDDCNTIWNALGESSDLRSHISSSSRFYDDFDYADICMTQESKELFGKTIECVSHLFDYDKPNMDEVRKVYNMFVTFEPDDNIAKTIFMTIATDEFWGYLGLNCDNEEYGEEINKMMEKIIEIDFKLYDVVGAYVQEIKPKGV